MKVSLFTRAVAAKLFLVVAAMLLFSTPSQAFFQWGHHYKHYKHFKHYKHVKTPKLSPASPDNPLRTPFLAQYIAFGGLCAVGSLGIQSAMAGSQGLSIGQAHGSVAGCFLPFVGQWLLAGHYQRLCALSRTNPAFRAYRIYCAA